FASDVPRPGTGYELGRFGPVPATTSRAAATGTLVPNANRHRPFRFDAQALGAGAGRPALAARSGTSGCVTPLRSHRCPASQGRQYDRRTETARVEGTATCLF